MTHTQLSTAALATVLLSTSLATACSGDATRTPDARTDAMSTERATMAPADSQASADAGDASGTSDVTTVAMNADPATAAPAKPAGSADGAPIVESAGKGGAPVDLAWHLDGKPQAGVPLSIDLDLRPTSPVTDVMLQVFAGPGLDAQAGHGDLFMSSPSRAGGYQHRVVVTPRQDGLAYVNVVAVVETPSGRQIRSFAVPVVVGEGVAAGKPKSADPVETGPDGERLRVLPAREDTGG